MSSDRKQAQSGLSVGTLMIASASSLIAAVVGSKLWGAGTLIGAALTPVIVAVASEGLHRPAKAIGTVRQTRAAGRFDPVAEGRQGLAEGDLSRARPVGPGEPERRVHRAGPASTTAVAGSRRTAARAPRSRRRLILAVATGLVAFVVAGVVLTGSELVLGNSVVSSAKRTTYIPVATGKKKTSDAEKKTETDAKTTTTPTTPTDTTATTQPGTAPQTTPTEQTPQANSVPAAPPPEQTAPAPSPAPNQPVPAPTTSQPAPTP